VEVDVAAGALRGAVGGVVAGRRFRVRLFRSRNSAVKKELAEGLDASHLLLVLEPIGKI
jgi:hypothetical protein